MEAEGRRKRGRPLSVFVWLYLDGCIRIRMYTMSIHLSQCPGTRSTTLARASAGARSLVEWPALRLAAYPAIARARARPRPAGRHSRHGRGGNLRLRGTGGKNTVALCTACTSYLYWCNHHCTSQRHIPFMGEKAHPHTHTQTHGRARA